MFGTKKSLTEHSGSGSRWRVEADFGRFAFGGCADFEKFAGLKAEHAGKNAGRELLNSGVEVADDGIVIAASILHAVFNLCKGILQGSETFDGTKLRIGLGEGEEAFQRAGELVFGLRFVGGTGGAHCAIAGIDNGFESAFFVTG